MCISTSQEDILTSKTAFEKLAYSHGVSVKSYHIKKKRFVKLGFQEVVAEKYR